MADVVVEDEELAHQVALAYPGLPVLCWELPDFEAAQ